MLKKITLVIAFLLVLSAVAIYWCNYIINKQSEGKLYADVNAVPYNKAGLLLGTSKYLSNGSINPYYTYRIDAAAALIKARKIKYLIISGDNSRHTYDEPTLMRADLISVGIDSAIIFCDYAGFRTFDSVIRAKEVFGQNTLTVISQPFHNQRALFIAGKEDIAAIGFNARDVSRSFGFMVQVREKLARVKVFVDYLVGQEPKFLGPAVVIPD